jgi:hypothetical protein
MSDLLNRLQKRADDFEKKYRGKSQFYYGNRERFYSLTEALCDKKDSKIGGIVGESQIEDAIIFALSKSDWKHWAPPFVYKNGGLLPTQVLFMAPQFQFGPYRADIMIVCKTDTGIKYLCVECDGHDYHQSEPYRIQRDGFFAAFGVKTIRLSGHDCKRHPELCASIIIREFLEWEALK